MSRTMRYGLYGAIGALLLIALIAITAVIVLQTPWFHQKVRERIVYEIEKATGGKVELRAFDFDWRRLSAQVRGLVIHGTESPDHAPLFRADSIEVVLKIVSVWKKNVDIESLVVRKPEAHIIVYPDGHTNIPEPKMPRTKKRDTIQQILDLAIGRFNLVNGAVVVDLRRYPLNVAGENLRTQMFYNAKGPAYDGELSIQQLDVTPGELKPLALDVAAKFALARNLLTIKSAHVGYKGSGIDLKGAVENFSAPRASFDYAAHIHLKEVFPALRVALPNQGMVDLGGKIAVAGPSGYELSGKLRAAGLAYEQRGISIQNISVESTVAVTPDKIRMQDLVVRAAGGAVAGYAELDHFRDFRLDATVRNLSIAQISRIQGVRQAVWNGTLSGPLHLGAEIRSGKVAELKTTARLNVEPTPGPNPVQGMIDLQYDHRSGTLRFGKSNLSLPNTRVVFDGTLGKMLDVEAETSDLRDAEPAIAFASNTPVKPLPVVLHNGIARFNGTVAGPLKNPRVEGHAMATNFEVAGRTFDSAEGDVVVTASGVTARNAVVQKRHIRATGSAEVVLHNWKAGENTAISGNFVVKGPSLNEALAEAGQANLPVSGGPIATNLKISGTVANPVIDGHAQALNVVAYGEPLDRVQGDVHYTPEYLQIASAQLQAGPNVAHVNASFQHPKTDWKVGRLRFDVTGMTLQLGKLSLVQQQRPGLGGQLQGKLAGEISFDPTPPGQTIPNFRIGFLNGYLGLRNAVMDGHPLGNLAVSAATKSQILNVGLTGDLIGAKVAGTSEWRLEGNYPVRGTVEFNRVPFSTILARFSRRGAAEPPFEGVVQGGLTFSGFARQPESFTGRVELPLLEIRPRSDTAGEEISQDMTLRNSGPVIIELTTKAATIRKAQLVGKDTNFTASGSIGFAQKNPWNVRVQGAVNLAVLRNFEQNLYSSGSVALDATLRGRMASPEVYGRLDLKNASLNYANVPNGINNANGVIFLYRDRATIERLTAETGGGKLNVTGFVALSPAITFHITAKADQVRVRYPEGVSSTADANLSLTGTSERSVLSGDVTLTRIGFNPRTDLGSILAQTANPVQTPRRPGAFTQGLRFDVHIQTSPQVRLETKLTRDIQAEADLRLRGDITRPVLLGRILINQGEILFFGNQYTINSGEILFVNASKIQPNLNMDLETRVRGIDVNLNLSGPINKLNVTYRSDPPLQFSEIIALLTTGRTPASTPGLIGTRSELQQSWQQAGASALVSQAIASPLAGRLQRFFGVSRLKIDPQLSGVTENQAAARVTLEQQISSEITFTYITDVARAQAQTIRVEWDLTKHWSAVALREESGLFGIDFLYKKTFK